MDELNMSDGNFINIRVIKMKKRRVCINLENSNENRIDVKEDSDKIRIE
jgi:hypothetical protein